VNEKDFPKEYRHIIRRLKQADESKDVAEQMTAEDELISDFQSFERQVWRIRSKPTHFFRKKAIKNRLQIVKKVCHFGRYPFIFRKKKVFFRDFLGWIWSFSDYTHPARAKEVNLSTKGGGGTSVSDYTHPLKSQIYRLV
jgi:hypothetical protein